MRKQLKKVLTILSYFCFFAFSLNAYNFTENYNIKWDNKFYNFEVAPKNCDLTFLLKGAKSYSSYFITKNDVIYELTDSGWVKSEEKAENVLKMKEECKSTKLQDDTGVAAECIFGDKAYICSERDDESFHNFVSYSYIPLSSQLSSPENLVNVKEGTFLVLCLLENNKYVTIGLKPSFDLYNMEYNLLNPKLDTEQNQMNILEKVFMYQSEQLPEDQASSALKVVAAPSSLPQFIAESIWNMEEKNDEGYSVYKSKNIPASGNGYIKRYLQLFYDNEYPILYSSIYLSSEEEYNPKDFTFITEEEGKSLAENAKTYLTGAIAYKISAGDEKHKKAENPVPYAEGGIDSPVSFNKKMSTFSKETADEVPYMYYESDDFKAGDSGIYDYMRNAGCDSLGFLTGAIGMTDEITDKVLGYEAKNAGLNNRIYAEYTEFDEVKESKEELYESVELQKSRFELYEIEKISVIITEYSDIRAGDILVNNQYSTSPVAIVTEVAEEVKGMDDVTVVYIEELSNGTAKEGKWSELPESQNYYPRRIVKTLKVNSRVRLMDSEDNSLTDLNKESEKTPTRNELFICGKSIHVFNDEEIYPLNCSVKIKNIYECEAPIKTGIWRWMPNTGEYLCIEIEEISLKNAANNSVIVNDVDISIIAKDRNYDEKNYNFENDANIHNNTESNFEIGFANSNGNVASKYSLLKKDKSVYTEEKVSENDSLKIVDGKTLKRNDSNIAQVIYIRPENAKDFRPGNDLILGFKINGYNEKKTYKIPFIEIDSTMDMTFYLPEDFYIACYDKKALWRANLYIQESTNDWNNQHPWNVPYDVNDSDGSKPYWWDSSWGYNEWNYLITNSSNNIVLENNGSPKKLGRGNGGQVISIPNTKWYYGSQNAQNGNFTNRVRRNENNVAYDHQGWDSPFSFSAKMESQYKLMNQWYITKVTTASDNTKSYDTIRFGKPIYKWNNYTDEQLKILKEDDLFYEEFQKKITDIKECLGAELIKNQDDSSVIALYKKYYRNSSNRFYDLSTTQTDDFKAFRYDDMILPSDYSDDNSPYNTPKYYLIHSNNIQKTISNVTGDKDAVKLDGIKYYPYIPGLSDSIMVSSNNPDKENGKDSTWTNSYPKDSISPKVAGTDCNGLVQRSFSYKSTDTIDSFYSALNKAARRDPVYWNSTLIPESRMSKFFNRISSKEEGSDGKGNGSTATRICKNIKSSVQLTSNKTMNNVYISFENIVPGDVIGYTNVTSTNETYYSHIMMISDVAIPSGYDQNKKPYWSDGMGINLIESVYHDGDECWGVTNKRNIENLNSKTWSIWRQK